MSQSCFCGEFYYTFATQKKNQQHRYIIHEFKQSTPRKPKQHFHRFKFKKKRIRVTNKESRLHDSRKMQTKLPNPIQQANSHTLLDFPLVPTFSTDYPFLCS